MTEKANNCGHDEARLAKTMYGRIRGGYDAGGM